MLHTVVASIFAINFPGVFVNLAGNVQLGVSVATAVLGHAYSAVTNVIY
jgi:hypothetical protein